MFTRRNLLTVVMAIALSFVFYSVSEARPAATCTCNVSNQTVPCPVHRCTAIGSCNHNRQVSPNGAQQQLSPREQVALARELQRMQIEREQHQMHMAERQYLLRREEEREMRRSAQSWFWFGRMVRRVW